MLLSILLLLAAAFAIGCSAFVFMLHKTNPVLMVKARKALIAGIICFVFGIIYMPSSQTTAQAATNAADDTYKKSIADQGTLHITVPDLMGKIKDLDWKVKFETAPSDDKRVTDLKAQLKPNLTVQMLSSDNDLKEFRMVFMPYDSPKLDELQIKRMCIFTHYLTDQRGFEWMINQLGKIRQNGMTNDYHTSAVFGDTKVELDYGKEYREILISFDVI